MSDKDGLGFDFGSIGEAMKGLQDAYSDGLGAMDVAGDKVAEEMEPSHRIFIEVKASAKVESHDYKVEADLEFLADLNSILESKNGDIASLLGGLGVDELSEEESGQVVDQLSKPRCIAVLDKSKIRKLELYSDKGKVKEGINKKATMLVTLVKNKINLSFESVFALTKLQTSQNLYYAIPSQEMMQKNIVLDIKKLNEKKNFAWTEKDKDNLKVEGSVVVEKI